MNSFISIVPSLDLYLEGEGKQNCVFCLFCDKICVLPKNKSCKQFKGYTVVGSLSVSYPSDTVSALTHAPTTWGSSRGCKNIIHTYIHTYINTGYDTFLAVLQKGNRILKMDHVVQFSHKKHNSSQRLRKHNCQ